MRVSDREARLIRDGFAAAEADPRRAGRLFYRHLFDLAPGMGRLFLTDVDRQSVKLIATLGVVVSQLETWVKVVPVLDDLAVRHLAYGVRPEDYPPVGAALQAMLRDLLGADFTPEASAAWARVYDAIQAQMIAAAYGASAEAAQGDKA